MSNFQFNTLSETASFSSESLTNEELEQHLSGLQRSHALRYQIANLEIWSLANTMDNFIPGFWSRFMFNRQVSLREFLERKKAQPS